jgi:hypothetical protein
MAALLWPSLQWCPSPWAALASPCLEREWAFRLHVREDNTKKNFSYGKQKKFVFPEAVVAFFFFFFAQKKNTFCLNKNKKKIFLFS